MSDYEITGPMVTEVIGRDERRQIVGLAADVNKVFYDAGIRARSKIVNGHVVYALFLPTPRANFIITARVLLPSESFETVEVGAGKVAKKLKAVGKKVAKAAKKVANSKVVKKLAKVVGPIAAVVPGLQPVAAGIAVATAAKKVVSAAKKGNPKAKKLVGAAVKGARIKLAASTQSASAARYQVTKPDGALAVVSV